MRKTTLEDQISFIDNIIDYYEQQINFHQTNFSSYKVPITIVLLGFIFSLGKSFAEWQGPIPIFDYILTISLGIAAFGLIWMVLDEKNSLYKDKLNAAKLYKIKQNLILRKGFEDEDLEKLSKYLEQI